MINRKDIEKLEEAHLAPYAVKSGESYGRQFNEEEHSYRTRFQRDRDRVIHSSAFRRLEYKTQVFVYNEGDYYRTGSVPAHGLAQARQIGHITYLSPGMMDRKFGRERVPEGPDPQEGGGTAAAGKPFRSRFQVESW